MNGANDGNQNNPGQALWLPKNAIVTPEEYRRNQERLAAYRQSLAQMEHENEEAYRRYTLAEQELRNRVEQGKEAEYVTVSSRDAVQYSRNSRRILQQLQAQAQRT